jgi:hypothetical protein
MRPILVRLLIVAILVTSLVANQASAQSNALSPSNSFGPDTPGGSHAAADLRLFGPDAENAAGWLFPTTNLNQLLPSWIQLGGQFRNRAESMDGLGYQNVDDVYNLTQLRLGVYIQPTKWLKLVGVMQDSRAFSITTYRTFHPTKTFGISGRLTCSLAVPVKAGSISSWAARCSALATNE